jgi:magnesium chelatase subunit D
VVGDRPVDPATGLVSGVAVGATVRTAAARISASGPAAGVGIGGIDGEPLVRPADVREAVREHPAASLVVIAVDASGSMGARERVEAAKGAVLTLLLDAYQRRDLVSLVSFRGEVAEVLLRPTGSVEVARARLADLATGGRTPLAAGILSALDLATAPGRADTHRPLLVLITDGRATSGPDGHDPLDAAVRAAAEVRRRKVDAVVVDVEGRSAGARLGLAASLAARMGAAHVALDRPTPEALGELVRAATLR